MHFMQYVRNAWTSMAMCDYPYPTNFLAKLPAWPVKAACKLITGADDPVKGLAAAVKMVYYTGPDETATHQSKAASQGLLRLPKTSEEQKQVAESCLDMYTLFVECADQTGCGTGNDAKAWDYQMCSDITIIVASNNKTDMFPERPWTLDTLSAYCAKHYGTKPDPSEMSIRLGAINFSIFFLESI